MRLLFMAAVLAFVATHAASAQEVFRPGNGVTLPQVVTQTKAAYTQAAMEQHIEGTVLLSAVVRDNGAVADIAVEKSLDSTHGLDQQAVDSLKLWTFKPGTKDGKPVAVRVSVEIRFTLK